MGTAKLDFCLLLINLQVLGFLLSSLEAGEEKVGLLELEAVEEILEGSRNASAVDGDCETDPVLEGLSA